MFKLRKNLRPIFFALLLTLGFYLFIHVSSEKSAKYYITSIILNISLLIFQLAIIKSAAKNKLIQIGLPSVNRYSEWQAQIYHNVIPLTMLLSFYSFVYFNPVPSLQAFVIAMFFISFSLIFINIRTYIEDKFKLELATHFVYAFAMIFGLMSFTNAMLNLFDLYGTSPLLIFIPVGFLSLMAYIFIFSENINIDINFLIIILFFSLIIGAISTVLFIQFESKLRNAFIISSVFYLSSALIHHKEDGTLSLSVYIEYIILAALSFILLYGIE